MPAKKPINQLDPFGDDEDRYQTREIRHSRSRSSRNPFINLSDPKSKEGKRSFILLSCILLAIIVGSILIVVLSNRSNTTDPTSDGNPLVNPTGREASSEYTVDKLDDPDLRASEQSKLDSVLTLISEKDWVRPRPIQHHLHRLSRLLRQIRLLPRSYRPRRQRLRLCHLSRTRH